RADLEDRISVQRLRTGLVERAVGDNPATLRLNHTNDDPHTLLILVDPIHENLSNDRIARNERHLGSLTSARLGKPGHDDDALQNGAVSPHCGDSITRNTMLLLDSVASPGTANWFRKWFRKANRLPPRRLASLSVIGFAGYASGVFARPFKRISDPQIPPT